MDPKQPPASEENQPSGRGSVSFGPQRLIKQVRRARSIWLLLTGDIWGFLLLIGLIAIATFAIVGFSFGGGGSGSDVAEGTQACGGVLGINIDPANLIVSSHFPAVLDAIGCVDNATYTWSATSNVGSFVTNDDPSTVYIPPAVASGSRNITITLNVCAASACTKYTTVLVVIPDGTGITCTGSNACLPADNQYCITSSSTTGLCPVSSNRSCCQIQKTAKPPAGVVYTCPSGDYLACLRQDFNISVENSTAYERKITFQIFAYAAKAPNYLNLLKNGGVLHIIYGYPGKAACSAYTPSGTQIQAGHCSISFSYFAHWIIHESGHVIADRNPYLKRQFPLSDLEQKDPACYDSYHFLRSYPLSGACRYSSAASVYLSESFAEALSYYTTYMYDYNPWNSCQRFFNTFKTKCPNTYAWEKQNIYSGYDF